MGISPVRRGGLLSSKAEVGVRRALRRLKAVSPTPSYRLGVLAIATSAMLILRLRSDRLVTVARSQHQCRPQSRKKGLRK